MGHSDIVGNEEAEKLAKQAAAAEYIGPQPALRFSTIAVRSKVRQWAHNEHYKHWLNTEGCRQAKELVTQVTPGLTQCGGLMTHYVLSARKRRKQVFISLVNAAPQPINAGCISEFFFWNLET